MTNLKTLRVAALAGACMMLPIAAAQAQDKGGFDISDAPAASQTPVPQSLATSVTEITFGVGGVSQSSAVFGRYNGMPNSGVGALGGWNLQRRDAPDSGGTHYYSFTGDNIDFGFGKAAPEATVNLKVGEQGQWGVSATYDAMTYTATDNFMSILDKNGNLSPAYQAALTANGLYFTNVTTAPPASAHFWRLQCFDASRHFEPGDLLWARQPIDE